MHVTREAVLLDEDPTERVVRWAKAATFPANLHTETTRAMRSSSFGLCLCIDFILVTKEAVHAPGANGWRKFALERTLRQKPFGWSESRESRSRSPSGRLQ